MSSAQKRVGPVPIRRKRRVRRKPRRPTDHISVEEWNLLKNLCDDQSRGFLERFVSTMTRFEKEKSLVLTRVCLCKRHVKKKRTKKKVQPKESPKELPTVPFTTCFSDDGCRMPCGTLYPPLTWKPLRQALAVKYGFRPAAVGPTSAQKSAQKLHAQGSINVLRAYRAPLGADRLGNGVTFADGVGYFGVASVGEKNFAVQSSSQTFGAKQQRGPTRTGGKPSMARVNFNTSNASVTLSPTRKARQAAAEEHKKFSALIEHLSQHYTHINETEAQRLYEEEMRRLYAEAEPYMYEMYEEPYDLEQPWTWMDIFPAEVGDKYRKRFSY